MKLVLLFLLVLGSTLGVDRYTPVQINILFRHGSRAPIKNYLNFSWVEHFGEGGLTGVGMRMHYNLGQSIMRTYPKLFGDYSKFNTSSFKYRSSSVPRTVQSGLSHLHGMFQPSLTDINKGFGPSVTSGPPFDLPNFKPITYEYEGTKALPYGFGTFPIETETPKLDFYFRIYEACPLYKDMRDIGRDRIIDDYDNEELLGKVYDELKGLGFKPEMVDEKKWSLKAISRFYDVLYTQKYFMGTNWSEKATDDFYLRLARAKTLYTLLNYPTEDALLLYTHTISKDMLQTIENYVEGKDKTKIHNLYSGHDSNVMPFMVKSGISSLICMKKLVEGEKLHETCEHHPDYAANFIWELNLNNGLNDDYYVRTLFNGKPIKICSENRDEYYCSYTNFKKTIKSRFMLKDFMGNCGNLYYPQETMRHPLLLVIIGVSFAALAMFIFMLQAVYDYQSIRKKVNQREKAQI